MGQFFSLLKQIFSIITMSPFFVPQQLFGGKILILKLGNISVVYYGILQLDNKGPFE